MDISSYVLLSQEQALRRRLDVAANNMANISTPGFRRERPVFHEYVEHGADGADGAPDAARNTSYVLDYGATHDTMSGAFQPTGNPLDMMIDGPGYLAVEAPGGGTAYTRAGFVRLGQDGALVASGGQRILGEGGKPILIPPEEVQGLAIGSDGTVSGRTGPLGRVAVTVFDDESTLAPRGDGMATGAGGRELPAAQTRLQLGGVEQSNVQPIVETTSMVEILRAYQSSMKLSQDIDDLRRKAIDRLGKFN